MIVSKRRRGFISLSAHPLGCAESVRQQVSYTKSLPCINGAKRVLVIGASAGYGLASRIASTYACGAATIGVALERPAAGGKTASAGWYNTAAFERLAQADGYTALSIMGDAFATSTKDEAIALIERHLGGVDMVVYSIAAPRRMADDGKLYSSVLKPIGADFRSKTVDLSDNAVKLVSVPPATEQEIQHTVKVMGGEDWQAWMERLLNAGVLLPGAKTLAYSYVGPELMHPIYANGTIGMAKRHLSETAVGLNSLLAGVQGRAYVSVNKAVVTQASAAIPVVPLYISILFHAMKARGVHEGCIEQICRLYRDRLFVPEVVTDEGGLIRMDDLELRADVQGEVRRAWESVDSTNLRAKADIDGFWDDFDLMGGFGHGLVDYERDVDVDVVIPSLAG